MRVRDWQDIVSDVVESDADPEGWRAVAGDRQSGLGEDMYLGHPSAGVFLLKTYAKNPYEVRGVGTRVARKIDDEIGSYFPREDSGGRFGVQSPPEDEDDAEEKARRLEQTVKAHADAPTTPDDLFSDVMEALDSPAYGPMEYEQRTRPEGLDDMSNAFEEAEELLDAELDDVVTEDDVGRGFQ
ncbi:MAG: hypothetical protein ABEH66_02140 [Halobacteriales archaeon]